MRAFFSANGRLSRLQFLLIWLAFYGSAILALFFILGSAQQDFDELEGFPALLAGVLGIATVVCILTTSIRRAHDFGMNWIIPAIAVVAAIFFPPIQLVLFILGIAIPGNPGPNIFGPQPQGAWPSAEQYHEVRPDGPMPVGMIDGPNMVGVLAKFAKADGVIGKAELRVVNDFLKDACGLQGKDLEEARNTFRQQKDSPASFADFARAFFKSHSNNPTLLCGTFDVLVDIAWADGRITPQEQRMLQSTIIYFQIEAFVNSNLYSENSRASEEKVKSQSYSGQSDPYEVLGIKRGATHEEVRSAYREKCKQYHPDLVRNLGPKLRALAESELKAINDAYEKLKPA